MMGAMKLLYTRKNEPTGSAIPRDERLAWFMAALYAFQEQGCPGRREGEGFWPALKRWRKEG